MSPAAPGTARPHCPAAWVTLALVFVACDEGFGPVSWVANEFVLVDSLIGQGRYEVLARWPLRGAAAPVM